MKIAMFGGTFDPPHNTHVAMAQQVMSTIAPQQLLIVPCGDPPHKSSSTPASVRMELCRLAFGEACVWDYEVTKSGKSYTVETLRHLHALHPDAQLYLVIGGDSLGAFCSWYCPGEIAKLAILAVARRSGDNLDEAISKAQQNFGARIVTLNCPPTPLSSTEIRLRYQFGLDNSALVPADVDSYVLAHGLYGEYRAMVQAVRGYLTEERFLHTYHVVKRGQEIAPQHLKQKAFVACLLHDVAKYIPVCKYAAYGFEQGDLPEPVVHSFLGSNVARQDFGITDEEILSAIAYHTTGRPQMTELDKVVYVADKTEDTRPYPMEHLRQGTLSEQFIACLKEAYGVALQRHCSSLCPLSELTIRYYCAEDFGLQPLSAEQYHQLQCNSRRKPS